MVKIAVIPIDNRPICYDLIKDITAINNNIQLYIPDIKLLGGLTTKSDIFKILEFIENLPHVDYLIISLDTVAYGGLINSRRCNDSFETIKARVDSLKAIAKHKADNIYGFSSILRISNNNINEEEKPYWKRYGKRLFAWSYNYHRSIKENIRFYPDDTIPKEIMDDFLMTRKRNHEINRYYLELAREGFFNTLIFSKDDCAAYGLNVQDAENLQEESKDLDNVIIKTGADEIPLALISRAISKDYNIKIYPEFIEEESKHVRSKYEDISIEECVNGQIELAGCSVSKNPKKSNLTLLVNNFRYEQGDLVLGNVINKLKNEVEFPILSYFVADCANANGADTTFIETLFKQLKTRKHNFYGYAGYNTSANTLGCAICCAIMRYTAEQKETYNRDAFLKVQFIRFMDDWAYQAVVRESVAEDAPDFSHSIDKNGKELISSARRIMDILNFYPSKMKCTLPWHRSFEIRFTL